MTPLKEVIVSIVQFLVISSTNVPCTLAKHQLKGDALAMVSMPVNVEWLTGIRCMPSRKWEVFIHHLPLRLGFKTPMKWLVTITKEAMVIIPTTVEGIDEDTKTMEVSEDMAVITKTKDLEEVVEDTITTEGVMVRDLDSEVANEEMDMVIPTKDFRTNINNNKT